MAKSLVIAEKPSVAQDLARALGKFERQGDYFEGESLVISSAVGHLLEIAPPEGSEPARGKWKIENLPSIPPHFDLVPIERNAARLAVLKKLLKRKDIDSVINACDAGREGELIFRNVLRASGVNKPQKRLWLQSMTPEAIRTAFSRLRPDEEMLPLADAAMSRAEADWLVGINSTRALTAFNSADGGFHKTPAGRVQTPTLAILVEREEKIRAFSAKTYFEVFADFDVAAGSYRGRWFDESFQKKGSDEIAKAERIWDKAKAEAIYAKCLGKKGIIEEEKKPTTQAPPLLYDLTTLQREANQRFGFPARMTLQIAQALYEKHKVLTYPRTDSRYLPEDHLATAKTVLETIADPTLAKHATHALDKGWVRPNKRIFNNAKVSDHFAIVPTGTAPKTLDDKEQRIFDLVSRRFIAVFYPAAQFEVTTRITRVEGEAFKTDGKIIVDPGWMAVYGRQAENDEDSEKAVCAVKPGEPAQVDSLEVKESETKPPARFNEATLLSAMEGAGKLVDDEELRDAMSERGLGTPATRAQIIEGLLAEGYILRQGRDLVATAKGMSLITLLRDLHAEALTKPELTGEWEFRLKQMERGQLSRADFMSQIGTLTKDLVEKVRASMGKEVSGQFKPLEVKCPRCAHEGFKESFRCYECTGCKLTVWKTMAAREFEREEVVSLLQDGKVGPLEGFRSKLGRAFAAHVHLDEKSEWKQRFDFEKDDAEGATMDLSGLPRIAPCPVCKKGEVVETEAAFLCEHVATKTCKFRMGKMILQQAISAEQTKKLCETGKTDLLRRFISKKGRPFSAFLKLDGEKVGFEFEERKPKTPKAPKEAKVKAAKSKSAKAESVSAPLE
ncbi:MAG: DNA topoisomerase III [Verrucomicrobiota bacterium]